MRSGPFIFFFFFSLLISAQNRIDSLKKLGREKLIALAVQKINDPAFDASQYDRVLVKYNKKQMLVEFCLSLVFTGKDCYYSRVGVALAGDGTGRNINGSCSQPQYFKKELFDQKKIDFVFNAINKDNEIGDLPDKKVPADCWMKISEMPAYYLVEMDSHSTFSHYQIEKETGNINEAGHKHYARDWDEKQEYEYLK